MLELPAEKTSPDRTRSADCREVRGRHRHPHRHSGRLVFLLLHRTTSHYDSVESA